MHASRRLAPVAVAVAALSLAAPAGAATVSLTGDPNDPWISERLELADPAGADSDVTITTADGSGPAVFRVSDAAAPLAAGTGCTSIDAHTAECAALTRDGVLDLIVDLGGGTNALDVATRAYAFGYLDGGPGVDRITAVEGDAVLLVHGLGGDDEIVLRPVSNLVERLAGLDDPAVSGNALYGGDGDDVVRGGDARDEIEGGAGEDRLSGGLNHDVLRGGDGDDEIDSLAGEDLVEGLEGRADDVACGAGTDSVRASDDDAVAADCETVERGLAVAP